jgi:hypothetical protein
MSDSMDDFRARLDIVALAEAAGAEVRVHGSSGKIRCPFTEEKTPSCHLYGDDGHYHCFGHQERGDAISLVAALRNISYGEAIGWISEKTGIPRPIRDPETDAWSTSRQELREAFAAALAAEPDMSPAGIPVEAALAAGFGLARSVGALSEGLARPALRAEEAAAWEGRVTAELHARAGLIGFGAFLPDGFTPQAGMRGASVAGLAAARETMTRHKAVVCLLDISDMPRVLASGTAGVVAPPRPLDADTARLLSSMAATVILAAPAAVLRSGAVVDAAAACLAGGVRPHLRAIAADGSLTAVVPFFTFFARWSAGLPAAERAQCTARLLAAIPSPTARLLTGRFLSAAAPVQAAAPAPVGPAGSPAPATGDDEPDEREQDAEDAPDDYDPGAPPDDYEPDEE